MRRRPAQLTSRIPETDSLVRSVRPLTHCQRAEASLASQFPELRKLGANSSGLDAVSGAAHTALAIMLMRQAVIYLLADMQGLQTSHEDSDSAFDLAQLGQPRDLLDLLKLAYHSSGGGNTGGGSPFATLWSLIDTLMRADSEGSEVSLPAPFKALPRLLRDDALAHLRRELKASATLHSSHPLATTKLRAPSLSSSSARLRSLYTSTRARSLRVRRSSSSARTRRARRSSQDGRAPPAAGRTSRSLATRCTLCFRARFRRMM